MRKHPTPSEALLWRRVCGSQLWGVRVRRQHPLHPYIADFYVASHRLVVVGCLRRPAFGGSGDIDGGVHRGQREREAHRDAELVRLYGVRVLRIEAELVECDVDAAVALVRRALGLG